MTRVVIVLPVWNEEIVLEQNARRLLAFAADHLVNCDWLVIVADNGSTDQTVTIGKKLAAEDRRVDYRSIAERGRGRALSRVWNEARESADILVYTDADLSADLSALPQLLAAVAADADLAYGSRFTRGARVNRSLLREFTSRIYRFLARWALGISADDLQCGFKAVSAAAWGRLASCVTDPGWFWDTELIFWAEKLGLKTAAVPVDWVEVRDRRRKSTVRLARTAFDYLRQIARLRSDWRRRS